MLANTTGPVMTTLHQAPVSTVLDRLFALDETASPAATQAFDTLSGEERATLVALLGKLMEGSSAAEAKRRS